MESGLTIRPEKKEKSLDIDQHLISEKAESLLCKQETTMRETISVSFQGKSVSEQQWNLTMILLPPKSAVSQANQSVSVKLLSTVPPFSLSSFQCPKPTPGEGHGKKGLLFLQVRSGKPTHSRNSGREEATDIKE